MLINDSRGSDARCPGILKQRIMKNTTLSGTSMPKRNGIVNFFVVKRNTIIEVIAALFILLFVYTGINKLIAFTTLKNVLVEYPIVGSIPVFTAWALPVTELIISLLLFFPRTKLWGLYSALTLMISFTLYLAYMLSSTTNLPCTCGGLLQKLSWPQHLIFNIIFVLLAATGIWLKRLEKPKEKETLTEITPIIFT